MLGEYEWLGVCMCVFRKHKLFKKTCLRLGFTFLSFCRFYDSACFRNFASLYREGVLSSFNCKDMRIMGSTNGAKL